MFRKSVLTLITASLFISACAAEEEEAHFPEPAEPPSYIDPGPVEVVVLPPQGKLYRDSVNAVVASGLGYLLRDVEVEAVIKNERFYGWRILVIRQPEWAGHIGVRVGDVLLKLNGQVLERETQAHDALQSLKDAAAFDMSIERLGEPLEIHLDIIERAASSEKVISNEKTAPASDVKAGASDGTKSSAQSASAPKAEPLK